MQLWIFDRSGAYSSETFNIRKEPQKFVRVVAGHAMMSPEELGLNTFINHEGMYPSITLLDAVTGEDQVLQLEKELFFKQSAIACRGTTCYHTTDGQHVIKFAWPPNKHWSEADRLSKARGVEGVPTPRGSRTLTTLSELRAGLTVKNLRHLGILPTRGPICHNSPLRVNPPNN